LAAIINGFENPSSARQRPRMTIPDSPMRQQRRQKDKLGEEVHPD
jgi:hypothetical protein